MFEILKLTSGLKQKW